MNREIKFRAWDKATSSMIDSDSKESLRIHLNGSISIDGVWATRDIELMQYTGLKDKNGIEIFEGDVVKAEIPYDQSDFEIFEVRFCESGYSKTTGFHAFDTAGALCDFYGGLPGNVDFKVIGNIYENPELLK